MSTPGIKKINLGCGSQQKSDYHNVDISLLCNPDKVYDIADVPWPWEDIERIEMNNLLEHFYPDKRLEIMNECHRVLRKGGRLWIRGPLLLMTPKNIEAAFTDPTHKSYFTQGTFDYWDVAHTRHRAYGKDYGCQPFKRISWKHLDRFFEIELEKV